MHRRKEFLIGSLIGLCIMLLALLAAVVAPDSRIALAQGSTDPSAGISLGVHRLRQGDDTDLSATLRNLPHDPDNVYGFPAYTHRFDLERKVGEEWNDADNCEVSPVGETKNIHPVYSDWKVISYAGNGLSIPTSCPIGTYRVKFVLWDENSAVLVTDTREFTVLLGPSVTIEMPSGPHYRGSTIDATIKFHELIQGASYTYEAYVMNDNPNYADNCEGTGLARNEIFSLGSVDENPEVRTGTITSSCPKENYYLTVRLFNTENRTKATKSEVFNITTNPAAIPSVSVAMSEDSPVTPGTEFDVIFNFYDFQDDTAIRYLDTLTNTGTNQPVGGMDCGGSLVGWGQDASATVIRNPIVNRVTITSDCPEGSYRLKSAIQDNSGNEIISGSIDFDIGDPDLTPTAPSVSNFTAKQNSPFNQQLPLGSGGDGTLSYGATPLPAGLSFNSSTRTIAGTPSGTGTSTVTYTVTDSDGDSDSVDFTITVDQDLTPIAPDVSNFTAKQNLPFSQELPLGSGGDGGLSYAATGQPTGLNFNDSTRILAGTPTVHGLFTITYTVTDADGDSNSEDFTITVDPDLTPILNAIAGYTARVGSPFSEVLPAATSGDGTLSYTATPLPDGLTFDNVSRTISGTPTKVEAPTVTYTVRDADGDEAIKTFTISVVADLTPTFDPIAGYTARVGSPFSEDLPVATGGDGTLTYTATPLPEGLSFDDMSRTVSGTPVKVEAPTVTYTVRDGDGDEDSQTFTFTIVADLKPTLNAIGGYTARVGSPFSEDLPVATGGDGTLTYTATPLPEGLSFDDMSRTVSGTPVKVEAPTVTYTVRDGDGDEDSQTFTFTIVADLKPTLNAIGGYTARVGSPFREVLPAATGGDGTLTYTATPLPDGLTFDNVSRTVSGTPTTVEAPTVTYTVRDADGDEAIKTFTISVVADLTPTFDPIAGYTARVGSPFREVLPAATGGDGTLTYTATPLPDGLTFDNVSRTVSGTPTTVEAPTVTYTVRDADGDEAIKTFTISVVADLTPTFDPIAGYTARVGSPFREVLPAATGGDGTLTYTATPLPDGLTFDNVSRTVSGTPTTVEAPTVTYTVRDADGDEAIKTFTITVEADLTPTLESIDDSSAKLTKVFTLQLPAGSEGDGDLVHDATGLPDGLTFVQSSRTITGTPTSAKDFEVTYTATDEDNDEARQTFHIVVYALPSLREVADVMATKDEVFTLVLTAVSGGKEPFTYTVTGLPDGLPTGLSFDEPSLTIAGTPTQIQDAAVTFAVEDGDGDTASQEFQISVEEDTEPTFPYTIPNSETRVGSYFRVILPGATGGIAPYTYTISGHPETLIFDSDTRRLSGTPGAAQTHEVTYTATDRDLDEVSQTFTLTIVADKSPTERSVDDLHLKVTRAFNLELPAGANGDPPYVYTVSVLPSGLDFDDQTRFISGTPDTPGMTNVTYTVTDDDGDPISTDFKATVYPMPSLIDVSDISIVQGDLYTLVLPEVTGGRSPFGYTAGGLPTGLQFIELTRTITGTPTTVETANVTYVATDTDGDKASVTFEIDVSQDPMPELDSVSDFNATKGSQFYALLPEASGGNTPLVYSVTGLPAGLQFITETRVITGTPTQMEVATVTYTVTDKDNDQDSVTFKITVNEPDQGVQGGNNQINNNGGGNQGNGNTQNPPALTLSDSTDFSARVEEQFTQQLPAANGGTSPYLYSVTTLPAGLTFNRGTHTISGTPTEAGTTTITYRVTDYNSSQASDDFTITVSPAVLRLSDTTGFTARVGEQFTQQLPEATGGTTPYQYSVTTLPAGLTFVQETRTITGTPTLAETKDVTYTVTDGTSNTASDAFTITVNESQSGQPGTGDDNTRSQAELTLSDTTGFSATVGELFTQQLPAASAGTPPYAYRVTNLPAGLSFVEITRTITGTPTLAETKAVIFTVSDSSFSSASDSFTITVNGAQSGQPGESGNGGGNQQSPSDLTLSDTTGFSATVGELLTQQLPAASGGTTPYAYMVTALPSGLSFVEITRTITGTPTMAETKVVTYTVADSEFSSASDSFTITVSEGQSGQQGSGGNNGGGNGGSNSGSKSNSGNSGNSGNKQRYIPPAPSPLPSQQRSSYTPIPVAITIPYFLNVRSGPGLDYEVITTVPAGTRANIYGRDPIDDWFQVQIEGIDGMVWIYQDLTTVEGSLDGVRFLEQWEIDLIARPGDGPLAITTPDILNVRSGPGLDYDILTTVPKGTQATIIGIGPDSEWYKVNLGVLSEPAWIYAGLTTVTGSLASVKQYTQAEVDGIETGADNPLAITVPTILNVRSGPGTEYEIVTTVAQGTQAEIIGIGPLDEWFLVELDGLDEPAWLYQDLTTVVGSLAGVRRVASWQVGQPSSDTEVERPIAVTYPSLVNVREGPGESYNVLKAIGQGTRARIMGIGPDENWYLVDIDGLDQLGWIREDLTVLVGSLDDVKRITAEEIAMLPVAIANTALLNVRSGPDTSYGLVTTISEGTWVEVIGVNTQSDWFKVKYDDVGGQGWVYRDLTYLAGPLASVTQVASAGIPTSTQAAPTQPADSTPQAASTPQVVVGSITVDLSLPSNGTIDLEVSWTDAGACSELYKIYYRSNTDSATYFSLETAVIASTANSKSLSFQTLPGSSLISAWCGTHNAGRQVAEVQIDSNVEGTYSSTPPQPAADAVAAGPVAASRN